MPITSSISCVTSCTIRGTAEHDGLVCISFLMNFPKSILAHLVGSMWRQLLADLENLNRQGKQMTITMLIMVIKHCVSDHCKAMADEDLLVNEKYNLITDRVF